jgi:tetratricopeptide (TPR) repeat protein
MSQKTAPKKHGISRTSIYAIGILIVLVIAIIVGTVVMNQPAPAVIPQGPIKNASDPFTTAGALYSQSVDLANAGNYDAALKAADQALAMNVTSLMPLIQTNRAGILVMMGKNDEAIAAADAALGAEGNLTTTHSVAYYNKGNALRALGKTAEADAAYANATALDPSLVHP